MTDQTALTERIAEALAAEFADGQTTYGMRLVFEGPPGTKPAIRMATPLEAAAVVARVLTGTADRAAVLDEAADALERKFQGASIASIELRRMAAEARGAQQDEDEEWDVPDARPGTTDHTLTQKEAQR